MQEIQKAKCASCGVTFVSENATHYVRHVLKSGHSHGHSGCGCGH